MEKTEIKNKKDLEKFINKSLPNHVPYLILTIERSKKYMVILSTPIEQKIQEFCDIFKLTNIKIYNKNKTDYNNTKIELSVQFIY